MNIHHITYSPQVGIVHLHFWGCNLNCLACLLKKELYDCHLVETKDNIFNVTKKSLRAPERFLDLEATTRLSRAALETLAIIAYQQPATRPEIDAIRGVNSDGVMKNLLSKGLIEEIGRTEGPGRPILYVTTPDFLQHFGLRSLDDLPPLLQEPIESLAMDETPEEA